MVFQQQVGPSNGADGAYLNLRSGKAGDLIESQLHARYYEQTYRKNMFFAATQSGQTSTVGLATTYVGLVVSNPVGNLVNLAINKVSFGWTVIAAAVDTVGIAIGFNASTNVTHTTPVTAGGIGSTIYGVGPAPTAKADTSATLPTAPVYYAFLGNTPTAITNPNGGVIDLEGSLLIPPGGYVLTATTAASPTSAFLASIQWEEIPL